MEIEFKFHVPEARRAAVEAALRRGAVRRTRLQARYFDTADGTLAAHGAALRLRKEGRRWVQTAKALGEGPLARLEHNVDLGPARAGAPPEVDVRRHAGTPVGERLDALLSRPGATLVETYATDIWRLSRVVRAEGCAAELALDTGRIVARPADGGPARVAAVCELELELVQGMVSGLAVLARRWAGQHGLWFSTVSKAERGTRLMAGMAAVPAVKAGAPRLRAARHAKHGPAGRAVQRAVVAACLAQMLPNATEIAAGSEDAEQVHQLRIGIRRLRTALRELAPLDEDAFDPAWEAPLVAAFRALGKRRDRELVFAQALAELRTAGAPEVSPEALRATGPAPGEVVRDTAFQAALIGLIGFAAHDTRDTHGLPPADTRRALRRGLQRLHRRMVRDGERFAALDTPARHAVRKRLKRLRYLAEFVAPLFDERRVADYLERLRPAQDALGRANDDQVAAALFREIAGRDARAWFAVGWYDAREPSTMREARRALRRIEGAGRFWKKGD